MEKLRDLFTLKNELHVKRDAMGRVVNGFDSNPDFQSPVVSQFLFEKGFRPVYPEGKKFACVISHDVDLVMKARWKQSARRFIRGNFLAAAQSFTTSREYPPWNLQMLIDFEKENNLPSSWFFMAFEKGDRDFNYRIEELENYLQQIAANGNEIGLHGSHRAFAEKDFLEKEKSRLEKITGKKNPGYRNHFLRFSFPLTWKLLSDAGFEYDNTLGYSAHSGFRNGMCYPFHPYDFTKNEFLPITEIPLVVMDTSLFLHMKLNSSQAKKAIRDLIDEVQKANGVFTLLWHNNYFLPAQVEVLRHTIDYLREQNAWFTTNAGLIRQWRESGNETRLQSAIESLMSNV